jgi:AraC-like DNA-binding protein
MAYLEALPSSHLLPFIECYWHWRESTVNQTPVRVFPDGCIELIFNFCSPAIVKNQNGCFDRPSSTYVAGHLSSFIDLYRSDQLDVFGVRFMPHGLSRFTRIPIEHFTDKNVTVEDVWGSELVKKVQDAPNFLAKIKVIELFLLKTLNRVGPVDSAVVHTLRWIDSSWEPMAIATFAESLNLSLRQLERRFLTHIGLSPKKYSSIRRLQYVLHLIRKNPLHGLTELGYEAGFYDQSHFIRDIKRITGLTPKQLRPNSTIEMSLFYNFLNPAWTTLVSRNNKKEEK